MFILISYKLLLKYSATKPKHVYIHSPSKLVALYEQAYRPETNKNALSFCWASEEAPGVEKIQSETSTKSLSLERIFADELLTTWLTD